MFSCCRTNPKNAKTEKPKKDKHKKAHNDDGDVGGADGDATAVDAGIDGDNAAPDRELIIPTITIKSAKANDEEQPPQQQQLNNVAVDSVGADEIDAGAVDATTASATTLHSDIDGTKKEDAEEEQESDKTTPTSAATATAADEQSECDVMTAVAAIIATSKTQSTADEADNDGGNVDAVAVPATTRQSSIETTVTNTTTTTTTTTNTSDDDSHMSLNQITSEIDNVDALETQQQQQQKEQQQEEESNNVNYSNNINNTNNDNNTNSNTNAPRSCLSRHNSMHTSIKKKVNISTRAEIIEPEPLPPPPYDHGSLVDEEDEVFSDSLPPPKRDSMCAPYIERDEDDELPLEAMAFAHAHGLPEWFNDERFYDIGCVEPPVTPVGRDELELRHQRLYAELLRAAHAAVRFSAAAANTAASGSASAPTTHDIFTYGNFDAAPPFPTHPDLYSTTSAPAAPSSSVISATQRTTADGDCDPDLKPSVAENLEHLVNRLERLVERLERSISARELEIANRTFDIIEQKKRESFDLECTDLPPLPPPVAADQQYQQSPPTQDAVSLCERIERIETSLNRINDRHSNSSISASLSQCSQPKAAEPNCNSNSLENIPTVVEDYQEDDSLLPPPPPSMSVLGYQDIVSGPLNQYLTLSAKIGGDVAKHAEFVKLAFNAQLQYVTLASQCAQPGQDKQMELLKPTSVQISAIQDYREKNRASPFFNHLSAISESIPALGWVCVAPTPGPHVKEMNDAGQFYTNRVLKEWKEKDTTHVEWARAWIQTLTELQAYIKQYHTTGLVWSGKGGVPAGSGGAPPPPPIGACPPPPPPPAFDLGAMSLDSGDERSALFAEINQGEAITKNLKKVTADMQTHKNPTLRTGPAPFKPTAFGAVNSSTGQAAPVVKAPVFTRDGKKWLIEYQKNNTGLLVDNAEMNNVVYIFKCENSTVTVKGKVNNIVLDSCKKCSLLFDSVVASIEFVNCQSVQMQVLGFVPTISIDKTDGCQMYLCKESVGVEIVSSKSSEMNVMLPEANGDYTELALPEQYKTTISGKTLKTVCVDSLG